MSCGCQTFFLENTALCYDHLVRFSRISKLSPIKDHICGSAVAEVVNPPNRLCKTVYLGFILPAYFSVVLLLGTTQRCNLPPCVCCCFATGPESDDIQLMMQGCSMVKVRSSRWQKSRNLRLLEDGLTVWCESSKSSRKAKAQQTCE